MASLLASWSPWARPAGGPSGSTTSEGVDDRISGSADEEDIDAPPSFPLPDSAQRSRASASQTAAMGPPSIPQFDVSPPSPSASSSSSRTLSPPRRQASTTSTLPEPTRTTKLPPLPAGGFAVPAPPTPSSQTQPKAKKSRKVALAPGCSPLDWARLKSSGEEDMRGGYGPRFPMRVTPAELAKHNTPTDAWSAFHGRVYNMTPYLRFHPGGEKELMRVAGRDGTRLFMGTHAWVSVEQMMDECLVGFMVSG